MTQGYTPTDNGIAHYAARGMDDIGICMYDEAKRRWCRWLAAHDAEVRDKALTLTTGELTIADGTYESSIKRFIEGHGIGEIVLGGEEEYLGQLQVAFQAGALWATRHKPDHDQQVADVDAILKGLGFGILITERGQVDAHRRYAAVEIVDALPLSDGEEESQ